MAGAVLRVLGLHRHVLAVHGGDGQLHGGLAPGGDVAVADADDALARLESGLLRQALGAADDGRVVLLADHEHRPKQRHAQDQVGDGAGGDDGDALPHALVVEGLRTLGRGHLALAFVEHLHVAAERNRGDRELGAVAVVARPQRLAEAHREAQHLDPAAAGDPEMAELVEGHQDAQADQHPPDGADDITHARGSWRRGDQAWAKWRAMASSVILRECASAASNASRESAATAGSSVRAFSTSAGIDRKPIRP
ncbi:hypothetical protein NB689_003487 [Xanthomonas sacchari]|nr:hypothetical protein [Xanthomonas sacchari]